MQTKPATIVSFDSATGEGIARLAEEGPLADLRFALSVCRGVRPAAGVRVQVGLIGPDAGAGPLSADFALRAGFVELASEWPELPVVQTIGITAPERGADYRGDPIALVPFDPSSFSGVKDAYPEELVAKLTFGPPAPAAKRDVAPYLELLATALRPVARIALACKVTDRDAVGGTFIAGDAADIGDVSWPTHKKKPMMHLLQIGLAEAARIGLKHQVNVFVATKPKASSNTEVFVTTCMPGARKVGPKSLGARIALTVDREVTVFPDIIGIQSAWASVGRALPLDLTRFHDVRVMTGGAARKLMSIQREIADTFPGSEDVEADVVLGGFCKMLPHGGRLATFANWAFDCLHGLGKREKSFVEWSSDDPAHAYLR